MSKLGERWWRMEVQLRALPAELREGEAAAELMRAQIQLWGEMPDRDKLAIGERLKVCEGK